LFPKINSELKRPRFQDIENIPPPKKKCDDGTESYSRTGVPKCFQQWQYHCAKCIAAQGEYFEGDRS
jgi:hypothetical protein